MHDSQSERDDAPAGAAGGKTATATPSWLIPLLAAWPAGCVLLTMVFGPAIGALAAGVALATGLAFGLVRNGPPASAALQPRAPRLPAQACLAVQIEGLSQLADRHGPVIADATAVRLADRLRGELRADDTVVAQDRGRLAVTLSAAQPIDFEATMQTAARLQGAATVPMEVGSEMFRAMLTVGLMTADGPDRSPAAMLQAATLALEEARRCGHGSIRRYSADLVARAERRAELAADLPEALRTGAIHAWFQPQVSTDTGQITGFEALARWRHPSRGLIAPGEFLPVIETSGRLPDLGRRILADALAALGAWDRAGIDVPSVSINLSGRELADPALADHIAWELDRHDLAPHRLTLEILESVAAEAHGWTAETVARLAALGCRIDLDDFGIGHASITSIRQFAVDRLKIDRSFVCKVDTDRDQQRMVTTILSMADQLGLDTLAEGVESAGEHAMLAQLGCRHVQGYVVAAPMPLEKTFGWLSRHAAEIVFPVPLRRGHG